MVIFPSLWQLNVHMRKLFIAQCKVEVQGSNSHSTRVQVIWIWMRRSGGSNERPCQFVKRIVCRHSQTPKNGERL